MLKCIKNCLPCTRVERLERWTVGLFFLLFRLLSHSQGQAWWLNRNREGERIRNMGGRERERVGGGAKAGRERVRGGGRAIIIRAASLG